MVMAWDVLVADFGMNQYYGGFFDLEERLEAIQDVGYQGLERLTAATEGEALEAAATFHRMGMTFATVRAPSTPLSIRWTAAFGRAYVWSAVSGQDHDTFCRQVNDQAEACDRHGILVAVHNHMGTPVETHDETVGFLEKCPKAGLIFDTAHLAAVGGDPVDIATRYCDRIVMVHFKDWVHEREHETWTQRGRFTYLGGGNIDLNNIAVVQALQEGGYEGPVAVEQDTHLQDPIDDLRLSMAYLRAAGV
jgi:sugar phosphate isomerase/epimerase